MHRGLCQQHPVHGHRASLGLRPSGRQAVRVAAFVQAAPRPTQPAPQQAGASLTAGAKRWFECINRRELCECDSLIDEAACAHDDAMWLLQPALGRTAIKHVWRDWLRSVPDYTVEVVATAENEEKGDVFVLWRASGMARLPLVRRHPTTNRAFEHYGVTRLHFNAAGRMTDQWTWRGATTDEAEHLLTRTYRQFTLGEPLHTELAMASTLPVPAVLTPEAVARQERMLTTARIFRAVFGAERGADVSTADAALTEDFTCEEATGVWRAHNLRGRDALLQFSTGRAAAVEGRPLWHSEACTTDGRLMFVHFQNVLTHKRSGTLMGVASGLVVHAFDKQQRIERTMMFRGPMSIAERAEFFNMDHRASGGGSVSASKPLRNGELRPLDSCMLV